MAKISEIVRKNPWWKHGERFVAYDPALSKASPMFYRRKRISFERGKVYILRGTRQVGKTTYLKDNIKELIRGGTVPKSILYLSVDSFGSTRELRNALKWFLSSARGLETTYLFLDEITFLENWNLEIKDLVDSGTAKDMVIVATGSSSYELKTGGELLPGRGIEEYYLKPLSFREFVLQTGDYIAREASSAEFRQSISKLLETLGPVSFGLDQSIDMQGSVASLAPFKEELEYFFRMYLITGGFPRAINYYLEQRFQQREENMDSVLAETYVRTILGDMSSQGKQESLSRALLKEVVDRYGSRYSFSSLARSLGTTHVTTIGYLELLEASFLLFILYAYNFDKKQMRPDAPKKIYFLDPLIYHAIVTYLTGDELWNVITLTLQDEELQSKVIEGVVASHILANGERPFLREGNTFVWFYCDRSGREVDFVVKGREETLLGLEVKYQANVAESDVFRISPLKRYVLLSKDDIEESGNALIVPTEIFLAFLAVSERNL
jgi:hypothetical protein